MITSRQNARVKDIRRLRRSKGDRAIVEGPHLVAEALAADLPIDYALAAPDGIDGELRATLERALGDRLETIEGSVLEAVSDADSPRGVVAVVELPRIGIEGLPVVPAGRYVYADRLQEPGNLGALARVAEATGAAALALAPGSSHPNHPRALRASAGSLLRLPVAREADLEALLDHLSAIEPTTVALTPRGGDDLFLSEIPDGAVVLLIGGEGPGLDPALVATADRQLSIPMAEPVESLNATVAAAIALFELAPRLRRARRDGP